MSSKKKQLVSCKAALADLEKEIREAKQELQERATKLQRALRFEIRDDIISSFRALFDSESANLDHLRRLKEMWLKRETELNRYISSSSDDEETWEIGTSQSLDKKPVADKAIEHCKKYLFYSVNEQNIRNWVTVISKRRAVTSAHGDHSHLKPNDIITIYSTENHTPFQVKVSMIAVI